MKCENRANVKFFKTNIRMQNCQITRIKPSFFKNWKSGSAEMFQYYVQVTVKIDVC